MVVQAIWPANNNNTGAGSARRERLASPERLHAPVPLFWCGA